jgi:hypothetical protein
VARDDTENPKREHLFISYATEDADLAAWLTLKLTSFGYLVWCDQVKLLGGESYPLDIDRAIKDETFRMLALMSRNSVAKVNPVKERTSALALARQRKVNFLIPLNVDGMKAEELDWMTIDITFIPFHRNWADGFARLVRLLKSIGCPTPLAATGADLVASWFASTDAPDQRQETLASNLYMFESIPSTIWRVPVSKTLSANWPEDWPSASWDSDVRWSFAVPPGIAPLTSPIAVDWRDIPECSTTTILVRARPAVFATAAR